MVRAPRGHHSAQHPRLPSDVRGGPAVVSGPAPDRRFPGGARAPASARPWVRVRRSGARRRGPLCGESVNRCGPHKGRSPHPLGSRERTRVWAKQLPRPGRSPHVAFVGDCLRRPTPHPWLGLLETPCGVQRRARPSSALLGPPRPSSPLLTPLCGPGSPRRRAMLWTWGDVGHVSEGRDPIADSRVSERRLPGDGPHPHTLVHPYRAFDAHSSAAKVPERTWDPLTVGVHRIAPLPVKDVRVYEVSRSHAPFGDGPKTCGVARGPSSHGLTAASLSRRRGTGLSAGIGGGP